MTTSGKPVPLDGWEAHRRAQLVNGIEATPVQRLHWLEEAIAFAFRAGALPRPTTDLQSANDSPPSVS